jgi:putative Mn2+ efflux pump MntP
MGTLAAFIFNSILLGVSLAMDAFSVSMANGLNVPNMSRGWKLAIPLTFAGVQFLMPVIGWFCVRTIAEAFSAFQRSIPWIALILLLFIGGKMLIEEIRSCDSEAGYHITKALVAALIIGGVTLVICFCGVRIFLKNTRSKHEKIFCYHYQRDHYGGHTALCCALLRIRKQGFLPQTDRAL